MASLATQITTLKQKVIYLTSLKTAASGLGEGYEGFVSDLSSQIQTLLDKIAELESE